MKRLFKYILYFIFIPIWYLTRLYPRNKKIWVFGSWFGNKYGDNSKALFEYVNKNHPEIKCIWLTRNPKVLKALRDRGFTCFYANSFKGAWYTLKAGFVFVTSSKFDINYLFINGAKWIQLYHGAPLKKIGLDDNYSNSNSFFQRVIVKYLFPFAYEFNFHLTTAISSEFTDILSSAFNLSPRQIEVTGFPRNDNLFAIHSEEVVNTIKKKFNNPKIFLYLPTFRSEKEKKDLFASYGFDAENFQSFLAQINGVFISKGHFVDQSVSADKDFDRILHLSDAEIQDVYVLTKDSDILLTDYSSIMFDYLLLNRPIIYTAFDLEEYISESRELYFDYNDVVAGPIVKNWEEVIDEIKSLLVNDGFIDLRNSQQNRFLAYHDGENSMRVYEMIRGKYNV